MSCPSVVSPPVPPRPVVPSTGAAPAEPPTAPEVSFVPPVPPEPPVSPEPPVPPEPPEPPEPPVVSAVVAVTVFVPLDVVVLSCPLFAGASSLGAQASGNVSSRAHGSAPYQDARAMSLGIHPGDRTAHPDRRNRGHRQCFAMPGTRGLQQKSHSSAPTPKAHSQTRHGSSSCSQPSCPGSGTSRMLSSETPYSGTESPDSAR